MSAKANLKNITLSANAALLERARQIAEEQQTTLNEAFRAWLERFVRPASCGGEYEALMRRFSREELNER